MEEEVTGAIAKEEMADSLKF